MRFKGRPIALRYGCAVVSVMAAVGLRRLLDPWLQLSFPFATIFFAILLTAWVGGFKPTLTAVFLGAIAADYFLLAPRGSLKLLETERLGLLLYLATGLGIAALGGVMDGGRRLAEIQAAALRAGIANLEARVQDRTAALQQKTEALGAEIAERKQAEQALRLREAEFRTLTEAMPQIVWATNADGENIYFNQRWTVYTGLTLEESLGDGWNKPFHPEDRARAWEAWRSAVAGAGDYSLECRLRRADGVYRWWWILGAPLRMADGTILKWFGTCTDITDRKQAEEAVRESEERFRTMANSMPQLAWIAKADGYIFWYNQRWYDYTGTTPEQMEGWGWQSVHNPANLPKVMERWQAAIQSGAPFDMEFPLRRADGQFRTFLNRGQPLKDSAGRVVQWFGTNTDVDELKQAEEKIRCLNAELEQRVTDRTAQLEAANKELEAFSYSVSHDLRAPLRAVNGFAGMVLKEFSPQLPEAAKHYLDRIQKGGRRMGELIDDLLAFSRLNRQSVNWRTVEFDKVVQAAWEELKPQREGREIELRMGDLPNGQGDLPLLKQVWINLLSNAVKYTEGRTPAIIEIGCTREKGEDIYFVRDNGAGFDMQFAHKLFGVFQRLHRDDEFEGTGVGLAIVQRIIHRHGGRIWAQAELGRGATFYFTLGLVKPQERP